ncbi:MAG TPA: tetratricopeptide repeat protein [Candidatus Cybelea sp.]
MILLIHANGDVIDKETIASRLWPDVALTDGNLSQHMYMLRQQLDERAKDRAYVLTVRGRGYRFVAPVTVVGPAAAEAPVPVDDFGDALLKSGPEALAHYCRGCYLLEKRTATALTAAIEQFEAALHVDSEYVPALVGLSRAYTLLAEYWYAPWSYVFPKAKAAIVRALEIDPACAEARATLGNIVLFCDWNWAVAEREIETAVSLSAKSVSVYVNAAWFYLCQGAGSKALRAIQHALAIEPSSPAVQLFHARTFLHTGEYARAIDAFSSLIESGPDFSIARRYRAQGFILSKQPARAISDLLLLPQDRAEDTALRLPLLGRAYADCGEHERAEGIYRTLQEMSRTEFVCNFNLATVAVGLGRLEAALRHLEDALALREPALMMLRSLPWFAAIEQRARFKAVLAAIWPRADGPAMASKAVPFYSRAATGYTAGLGSPLASTLRTPRM